MLGGVQGLAAYRTLLRNSRFNNLFFAMLTSSLGDWIGVLAILALTKTILGPTRAAAFALSGVMIARILPTLLLGPVAGVFVDRWDRKRTLIVTDIGRGVVMFLIAFANDVYALFLGTLVIETMSTLFIPTKDALLPSLVERRRLVQANQLSLGVTYGTLPLGGALYAALAGTSTTFLSDWQFLADRPEALAIWFNALTFFASAVFIARIATPERRDRRARRGESGSTGTWQDLKEGFSFIANQPLIRALVIGVMAAFLAAGVVVAVGEFFTGVVNAGTTGFGVLVAVVGAGLVLGLVLAAPLSARIDKERMFAPGIGVAGLALIVTAFMPRLDLAAIPAFVMGVGAGVAFVVGYTLLQEQATDDIRGRTFAAFNTGVRLALFTSLVVGPALVAFIGPEGQQVQEAGEVIGATVPYQIGGVRITLIVAGTIALIGSVWTGRSISSVRERLRDDELDLEAEVEEGERARGLFITLEGGEGAGKSTQLRLLRNAVKRAGCDVVVTREPGGTAVGEYVRDLLLDPETNGLTDRAEALLYAAARAQLADEVIRPALDKGAVVLCDRFVDSSIVYQGLARGLGDGPVERLNTWGTTGLNPDLVILLDVEAEEGLRRVGDDHDRIEGSGLGFHQSVNEAFRRRAAEHPDRFLVLDASRPVEDLHADIRDAVLARLDGATTTREGA